MHPLAFTPGEPAGIGPDLCIQLALQDRDYPVVAVCSGSLIQQRAELLGYDIQLETFTKDSAVTTQAGALTVAPVELEAPCQPGKLSKANSPYVLGTLTHATQGCLKGTYSALVTGPIHKGIINEMGLPFSGHTEFLAEQTESYPVMMLACPELRVALATTHLPLSAVSNAITQENLERVITILEHDLRTRFSISKPRILVCGLNPHAGEGGHMGHEEIDTIIPVLDRLRNRGYLLEGPLPADTLFTPPFLERADAVLAMFHDQGLPVLKHLGFGRSVNITLGLPIIRTSVDHGTALDLAGTGKAHLGSLTAAIEAAAEMAQRASN